MKIYYSKNASTIKDLIKKLIPQSRFKTTKRYIELKGFKYGYIYNIIPRIENIEGVIKIENENYEIIPLAYTKNCNFKKPFDTSKKFIIAGPCVIDDFDIFHQTALKLKSIGVEALRTPLFKPRSSPYGFEGLGLRAIKKLNEYRKEMKIPFAGEVLDPGLVEKVSDTFDIIQIGARNMKNYPLLKEAASSKKIVLLKRQPKSTIREFLLSLEYLLKYGAKKVILCERGGDSEIPSLNLKIVKEIKKHLNIPVICDVSHSSKDRKIALEFVKKSIKYSDGIMIEVSARPDLSPIDTKQIIGMDEFIKVKKMVEKYNNESD